MQKENIILSLDNAVKKVDLLMERLGEKFPGCASTNLEYPIIENTEWTTSFWTGMLWLAYEYTGKEKYKELAEKHIQSFEERILRKGKDTQHHDLGFLYTLSCMAGYKLTGNEKHKEIALEAAKFLTTRYHEKAKIIQAWGDLSDPEQQGRMIIDCNMNLPLLYWATEMTGDKKYWDMAYSHVKNAAKYIVRGDNSTYHTYYMDVDTGNPKYGKTHQGYSDNSCWSRGQAWAIYGFILSYRYTKEEKFLELAKNLANYFIERLPEDMCAYWDLIFTEGDEPRDSSASAIAACGLLELVKYLPDSDREKEDYKKIALSIIESLDRKYVSFSEIEKGILKESVYNRPKGVGVNEFCSWGDYFYFESLMRIYKEWNLYW